jgi:flavin-dependent dehydrogenase
MANYDYDVVIIGSGFGGSVAALRAAEKGHRVGVMDGRDRRAAPPAGLAEGSNAKANARPSPEVFARLRRVSSRSPDRPR